MGTGTDVAMSSARVTLVKGDPRTLLRARAISTATLRNTKQNLAFAFPCSALGVPIAAGALYPVFGWLLGPMNGALAMSLSAVWVGFWFGIRQKVAIGDSQVLKSVITHHAGTLLMCEKNTL